MDADRGADPENTKEGRDEVATIEPAQTHRSWTWADQISTYRYWAVAVFGALSALGMRAFGIAAVALSNELGMSRDLVALGNALLTLGLLLGFYVAWIGVAQMPLAVMRAAGAAQLVAMVLLSPPALRALSQMLSWEGGLVIGLGAVHVLWGMAVGTVVVIVPAVLAQGSGGAPMLVVGYGLVVVLQQAIPSWLYALDPMDLPVSVWHWIYTGMVLVGLLLLIWVKPVLFAEPPPVRGEPLAPSPRSPVITGLLCALVPCYIVYWFYRAHGEVWQIAPSPELMSPRGAAVASLLVWGPLWTVMTASMMRQLNRKAIEVERSPYRSHVSVFVWTLLLFPVGVALVQDAINRSIGEG